VTRQSYAGSEIPRVVYAINVHNWLVKKLRLSQIKVEGRLHSLRMAAANVIAIDFLGRDLLTMAFCHRPEMWSGSVKVSFNFSESSAIGGTDK